MKQLFFFAGVLLIFLIDPASLAAQNRGPRLPFLDQIGGNSQHQYLRRGDSDYNNQDYPSAEIDYRKALEKRPNAQGAYNLGNAIYQQNRYDEAVRQYEEAAGSARDNATKAAAYHNLGNAYFHQEAYDKSIEAYKNALRLQPQDMGTKYNLALAQRKQRQQEEEQQQQQQQQQKEDEQKENEQKQDENKQQPNQDPSQNQPQSDDRQAQAQPEPSNLSKEEARRLLEIMEREERKVQEKIRKAESKPTKSAKDW